MFDYNNDIVEISDNDIKENHKPFPVKYCDGCSNSYEMVGGEINYHIDFPSYGLDREDCSNCS
ncbi:MAG: hypothetical protein H8D94_00730 [Candidatus Pelagibacter sp.]|nr:hypothetical protein [Candidatus Pelagibacter sp.]